MKPKVTVGEDGKVSLVTINMGKPFTDRAQIPMEGPAGPVVDEPIEIDGKTYKITSLLMGVPHTMTYVRDVDAVPLHELGPKFETYKAFPRKTNMNFVQVIDNHTIKVHTWERGAGATLACGTAPAPAPSARTSTALRDGASTCSCTSARFTSNTAKKTATYT